MPNPISVGIDLGTTFSAVAFVNENEQAEIIVNMADENKSSIPSVVHYESDTSIVVGQAALDEAEIYPDKTVQFVKRYVGEDYAPPSGVPETETPVKVQARILSAIKKYVEEHENAYQIRNAVVTVPAYFDFNKHNLTRQAAQIAELDVLGIINEPMAAAIYYCYNQPVENQNILVYDLGGGTFDSVIIRYRVENDQNMITTIASDGNHQLGGYDWDMELMSHLFDEAKKQRPDISISYSQISPDDRRRLLNTANKLKKKLGDVNNGTVSVKIAGETAKINVTRDKFEELTHDLLMRTGKKVDAVLKQAKNSDGSSMTESDIDLVLLVGGSTFMPMVQNYVRDKFGAEKVKLNNPNLAVAYGAAIYAYEMDKFMYIPPVQDPAPSPLPGGDSEHDEFTHTEEQGSGEISKGKKPPLLIKGQATHSVGIIVYTGERPFLNNLIFKGDSYTAQEPLTVVEDNFVAANDNAFVARFFGNTRAERLCKPLELCESDEEYIDSNADYLIEVKREDNAEGGFVSLRSVDQMTFCGNLSFEDERIREGDPIKVTLFANEDGIKATVEHIPTMTVKDIEFQNKDTLTPEEIAHEQMKSRNVTISLA